MATSVRHPQVPATLPQRWRSAGDFNSITSSIGATGDVVHVEMVARYLQSMLQQHSFAQKLVPPRIACVSQPSLVDVCAGDAMEPAYILPTRLWATQQSSDAPNPRRAQGPVTNSTKQQQKIVHFEHKVFDHTAKKESAVSDAMNMPQHNGITTLMVRNVPYEYTVGEFAEELNKAGFEAQYDLLYMPTRRNNLSNLGYAFVNFRSPESAVRFQVAFRKHSFKLHARQAFHKAASIKAAQTQGLQANLSKVVKAGGQGLQAEADLQIPEQCLVLLDGFYTHFRI